MTYDMNKKKDQIQIHRDIDDMIAAGPPLMPDSQIPVKRGAKDDQGGKIKQVEQRKYDAEGQIKKFGLKPVETFTYIDPVTKQKKSFTIDRRGTTEDRVALTLLDKEATREQKDSAVSMYLFERGKEGASMMMDLWAYKGAHTKESRAFQSTMRYDFETFLSVFQIFMQDSADRIEHGMEKGDTAEEVLVEIAKYFRMTSDLLGKRMRAEVEKRERAKGKGIYIDADNKPYSIYEDDDIVDAVSRDKASADAQKNGTAD